MSHIRTVTQTVADHTPPSERAKLLGRLALFGCMPPDLLASFAERARQRAVRTGEVLFRRGDRGTTMMVIVAGTVRIVLPSPEGREQVLRILQPGDVVGEMALLDGGARTADAIAETNGRVLLVERRDMLEVMRASPDVAIAVLGVVSERLRRTNALLESMLFQDTAGRLAGAILMLTDGQNGRRIDITQSALGERIGAARETVNKKLREWQSAGLITIEPGRITLMDALALQAMAPSFELTAGQQQPQIW